MRTVRWIYNPDTTLMGTTTDLDDDEARNLEQAGRVVYVDGETAPAEPAAAPAAPSTPEPEVTAADAAAPVAPTLDAVQTAAVGEPAPAADTAPEVDASAEPTGRKGRQPRTE